MGDTCEGYSYALSATDLIPIVLFAGAFWLLSTGLRYPTPQVRRAVNLAAVLLVVGSTLAGPLRKAFMASQDGATCDHLHALQLPFFTAMSACFALLAWAALSVIRGQVQPLRWWVVAVLVVWASYLVVREDTILLAGGGIFAVVWAGMLVKLALDNRSGLAAGMFVLYAVGTLGLPVLASSEDRTDASHQWLEQGANAFNMVVLFLGCYLLRSAIRRTEDRSVLVEN